MSETYPVVSRNESTQSFYERMRSAGESHSMAEMLATRSFPGVKGTDAVFFEGRKLGGQQFEKDAPLVGQHHMAMATKANVNTSGKWYSGTLARFPGDPRAWVSGLSDVRRVAEERGVGVTGAVEVKARESDSYEPPAKYRPADSIVTEAAIEAVGERSITVGEFKEVKAGVAKTLAGARG